VILPARIELGRHFPEPTKLVGAPVKVISRSVEYMIARDKLMIARNQLIIGRHELCTEPRIDGSESAML
jgi:hypothetical protein